MLTRSYIIAVSVLLLLLAFTHAVDNFENHPVRTAILVIVTLIFVIIGLVKVAWSER